MRSASSSTSLHPLLCWGFGLVTTYGSCHDYVPTRNEDKVNGVSFYCNIGVMRVMMIEAAKVVAAVTADIFATAPKRSRKKQEGQKSIPSATLCIQQVTRPRWLVAASVLSVMAMTGRCVVIS